jgi:DNA polymerase III epsilon subunit-like protein
MELNGNYLLFDVETNGLPKKRYASLHDLDNWPRIVQLAWGIYNKQGECIKIKNYIIKPVNFTIDNESFKIHKISNEYALTNGVDIDGVLYEFIDDLNQVEFLIAHNIDFDFKVISSELNRKNLKSNITKLKKICTMQSSTNFCKLGQFKYNKYKWPKLQELYFKLFNKEKDGLHDALVDIETCNECLVKLIDKNIIHF